jgi:hypothetical protein
MSQGTVEGENFFLRILHSFCVIRDMRNVLNRLLRIWQILGCLRYTKLSQNTRKESRCVHGKDAKIYNAEDISVNNGPTWNLFFGRYFLYKVGWMKLKNISRYCPFKKIPAKLARCYPSYCAILRLFSGTASYYVVASMKTIKNCRELAESVLPIKNRHSQSLYFAVAVVLLMLIGLPIRWHISTYYKSIYSIFHI